MDDEIFYKKYKKYEWIVGDIYNKKFGRCRDLREDLMQEGRLCLAGAIRGNELNPFSLAEIRVQIYTAMKNLYTKERINAEFCIGIE